MSRITKQAASAELASGSTRWIDLSIDLTGAAPPGGYGLTNTIRNNRSGLLINGALTINGAAWNYRAGKLCYYVPSGLGYGVLWGWGFPVCNQQPSLAGNQRARIGVTRFLTSIQFDGGAPTPNSDVGVLAVVASGASAYTDLTTVTAVAGSGKQGWGVLFFGGVWNFVIKLSGSAVGAWAEVVPLTWPVSMNQFCDVEMRMYDATFVQAAKMELWIAGVKTLTRYWFNPAGITSQTLPPFGDPFGLQLWFLQRNTSTGPIALHFADTELIVGPADAGTL
jgi:hypothetical protein